MLPKILGYSHEICMYLERTWNLLFVPTHTVVAYLRIILTYFEAASWSLSLNVCADKLAFMHHKTASLFSLTVYITNVFRTFYL